MKWASALEQGYANRLLKRLSMLQSLVERRMGPDPSLPAALDALSRTGASVVGALAPKPGSFFSDARALEVATTRDVSQELKADPQQLDWQRTEVQQALARWVQTNAALVTKLEQEILQDVAATIRAATARGALDLQRLVGERFAAYHARARLIARNELGNLQAQITELRARGLGAEEYDWISREDERVRPEHHARHGHRFRWDAPPPDGHPGQPIACRCGARPRRGDERASARRIPAVRTRPAATPTAVPTPAQTPARTPAAPVEIPRLPELTPLPRTPELPQLPTFTPPRLPQLPSVGTVAPVTGPPALAPRAARPRLPELQLPKLPPNAPARPTPTGTPSRKGTPAPERTPGTVPTPTPTPTPTPKPAEAPPAGPSRPRRKDYPSDAAYREAAKHWWFGPGAGPGRVAPGLVNWIPSTTGHEKAHWVDEALAEMPLHVQELIVKRGATVTVTRKLGEWDPSLLGVRPRGWAPGQSWDDVRGLAKGKQAVVALDGTLGGKGISNVTTHELGHAVDNSRPAGKASVDARWQALYAQARDSGAIKRWAADEWVSEGYFLQPGKAGMDELWAEAFSASYHPVRRAKIDKHFPELRGLMAEMLNED